MSSNLHRLQRGVVLLNGRIREITPVIRLWRGRNEEEEVEESFNKIEQLIPAILATYKAITDTVVQKHRRRYPLHGHREGAVRPKGFMNPIEREELGAMTGSADHGSRLCEDFLDTIDLLARYSRVQDAEVRRWQRSEAGIYTVDVRRIHQQIRALTHTMHNTAIRMRLDWWNNTVDFDDPTFTGSRSYNQGRY